MAHREDLLRPLLGGLDRGISIHSAITGYLAAFFGGPAAGACIALLNSRRLGRLRREWLIGPAALAVEVAYASWLTDGGLEQIDEIAGGTSEILPRRVLGLGCFSLLYLLHRNYYRGMAISGTKAPNGWGPGIAAVATGVLIHLGVMAWMAN